MVTLSRVYFYGIARIDHVELFFFLKFRKAINLTRPGGWHHRTYLFKLPRGKLVKIG